MCCLTWGNPPEGCSTVRSTCRKRLSVCRRSWVGCPTVHRLTSVWPYVCWLAPSPLSGQTIDDRLTPRYLRLQSTLVLGEAAALPRGLPHLFHELLIHPPLPLYVALQLPHPPYQHVGRPHAKGLVHTGGLLRAVIDAVEDGLDGLYGCLRRQGVELRCERVGVVCLELFDLLLGVYQALLGAMFLLQTPVVFVVDVGRVLP
mmetsp:Transcript_34643/g.99713  ORF Transcript_34643/g.99713 Transcript_34643/m.99713 type:complete len:202 (-) Transcript_34643:145-750(-)